MLLTELQRYLAAHGRSTLGEIALHFGVAPPAIEGMLDRLIRKGKVRRRPAPSRCRGCGICEAALLEAFEWVGGPATTPGPVS